MGKTLSKFRRSFFKSREKGKTRSAEAKIGVSAKNTIHCLMFLRFVCVLTAVPVAAAQSTANDMVMEMLNTILTIVRYAGIVILVWGIIQLLLAIAKGDTDNVYNALAIVIVGACVMNLKTIIEAVGIEGVSGLNDHYLSSGEETVITSAPGQT